MRLKRENNDGVTLSRNKRKGLRWLFLYVIYFLLIHLRYAIYDFRTLAGDDVLLLGSSNQSGGYASTLLGSLASHGDGKWRPVFSFAISPLLDLFSGEFWKYQLVNELLYAMCAVALSYTVWKAARQNFSAAAGAGFLLIIARFGLYNVLQVYGVMENLALLFFILCVNSLLEFLRSNQVRSLLAANLLFFFALHTHERFIFLAPKILLCSTFLLIKEISFARVLASVSPLLIVLEHYLVITRVFNMRYLSGGSNGVPIVLESIQIPKFAWSGVLNVFGYNSGPDYLSGRNAHTLGSTALLIALVCAIPMVALIALAFLKFSRERPLREFVFRAVFVCVLFLSMILSSSITIRQEFRWLLSPYVVMIGLLFILIEYVFGTKLRQGFYVVVLVVTGSIGAYYYAQYADGTYFFATQKTADSVFEILTVTYSEKSASSSFVIVDGGNDVFDWALGHGAFERQYFSPRDIDLRQIDTVSEITLLKNLRDQVVIFEYQNGAIVEVR